MLLAIATITKEEAMQAYIDWMVNTPEFKEEYKRRLEEYWDELIFGTSPPPHT